MNWKTIIPLAVALALGLLAAKFGRDVLVKSRQGAGAGIKMTKLVVAKEDISPGMIIKESDVTLKDVPIEGQSAYTFANPADVVGRVVTTQVVKGQVVMETFLARKGSLGGLQAMVPEGMRAVTLEVNEFSGVGGLLTPGSHVDIVQTIQGKGDGAQMLAKTIVENLTVIAVGRKVSTAAPAGGAEGNAELARSVTMLATAAQAEAIDLASHMGNPRLVLRNRMDEKVTAGKGVTVGELTGREDKATPTHNGLLAQMLPGGGPSTRPAEVARAESPKPVRPNYREIEVIRAGASSSVRINAEKDSALTDTERLLGELPQGR
jgi:pilus assembly protein CpaB